MYALNKTEKNISLIKYFSKILMNIILMKSFILVYFSINSNLICFYKRCRIDRWDFYIFFQLVNGPKPAYASINPLLPEFFFSSFFGT